MIMNDMIHGGEWTGNDIKIDFSVNLNPAGIPEAVKRLLQNAHPADFFGRYPDRECDGLRSLIAYKYKVDKDFRNYSSIEKDAIVDAIFKIYKGTSNSDVHKTKQKILL